MPETGGDPGEQRLAEIQALARDYYNDEQMPIFSTQRIKVMTLAGRLGDLQSWFAFASAVRALHRASGRVTPTTQDIKDYLSDLKRALTEFFNVADDRPVGPVTSVEQMVGSELSRFVIAGMLLRHKRGRIWFDDFLHQVRTDWTCDASDDVVEPYNVTEEQMLKIMMWAMARNIEVLGNVAKSTVQEAVAYVAYLDHRNVLVDHIRGVPQWDGVKRLRLLMTKGFGAQVDNSEGQTLRYLIAVGRNMMISLVARGLKPGCKVDTMPVFIGPQGTLKSTAMAVIGGPFYRVITHSPSDKDFYVCLLGCWLGEVAELASIASTRVEVNRVKAMLSTVDDHFREPYAATAKSHLRYNIFSGTGNQIAWMRDETGGRRFWPILCGDIDIGWLTTHRDQIIAEALSLYERGAKWWAVPAVAHAVAVERHQQVSMYEETIKERLLSASLFDSTPRGPAVVRPDLSVLDVRAPERWGNVVTPMMIAVWWLGIPMAQAGRHQHEITGVLTRAGWKPHQTSVRVAGHPRNIRCWVPADAALRDALRLAGTVREMADPPSNNMDIPF